MSGKRQQVCIVGAGPGGLASAMLMAATGADVTLIERAERVGGRCSAIERDGFRFDAGPTFFLYPRVLDEIFRAVGRDLQSEIPMTRLDPQYRLEFGAGGRIDATPDPDRMRNEIARISPNDAARFEDFMTENRRKLERFRPILESPFRNLLDLVRPSVLKAAPLVRPWRSVAADLSRFFEDPRLVTAFSFQSKYLGMSPFQCPSLFTILAFLEYEYGVFHPRGGCSAVSERMADIARDMGVRIQLGEEVQQIRFEGRRAVGVTTDANDYDSDALILNADFAQAMSRLVPDHLRRRWKDRDLRKKRYSCSTYMLYLGIDGHLDRLPHHTIYIAGDYQKNLDEIDRLKVLPEDPSLYVQNACVTDESLAPPGKSTLYILVPVPHRTQNICWPKVAKNFRERTLNQLSQLGIPDIRDRILVEHQVTPDDWEGGFQVYRGATFNLAHNLGQMLHKRPQNRFEDLDRVYLVGGGTHPGSGLPVIYESARISARLLCNDLDLPFPEPVNPSDGDRTSAPVATRAA